jgi:hypothetical protein
MTLAVGVQGEMACVRSRLNLGLGQGRHLQRDANLRLSEHRRKSFKNNIQVLPGEQVWYANLVGRIGAALTAAAGTLIDLRGREMYTRIPPVTERP